MSQQLEKAIEAVYDELAKLEQRAKELKKSINTLSALAGKSQPFTDVEMVSLVGVANIRPDQFYGKGLATAVREYLKMRGYASTAQEILDALRAGGFEFPKEWSEKFTLRNLAISLSKNRSDFVYLKASNSFGLWEFYPDKKRERGKKGEEETTTPESIKTEGERNEEQK